MPHAQCERAQFPIPYLLIRNAAIGASGLTRSPFVTIRTVRSLQVKISAKNTPHSQRQVHSTAVTMWGLIAVNSIWNDYTIMEEDKQINNISHLLG